MTEKQREMIDLIKYQATIGDLAKEFSITEKQVYQKINNLKLRGYNIFRKEFSNGKVQFGLSNSLAIDNSSKILYTPPATHSLRTIVISDTHLGNSKQRLDVLDGLYEYCIKNDVHIIFNCGDFLNGLCNTLVGRAVDYDYQMQVEKALKNYPYDPNILNYIILGNHDKDYLNKGQIEIGGLIERKRFDIIPVSYDEGVIKVKNDKIHLIPPSEKSSQATFSNKIIFRGHSHISKIKNADSVSSLYAYVPTCSDLFYDSEYAYPAMYDVTFNFTNYGMISEVNINNYIYNDKFIKTGEYNKKFIASVQHEQIQYEEKPKVLKKEIDSSMTPLDKFYARYNYKK